jgi:hypothetical protein
MPADLLPDGPDPAWITAFITSTFDDVFVASAAGDTFFSCNDKAWPNFATLVTTNAYDDGSDLDRDDVFRLNIGVGKATFESRVGSITDPDFAALDRLFPHPTYAAQRWLSVLNPSTATFDGIVRALLVEAHEIAATREAKQRSGRGPATEA